VGPNYVTVIIQSTTKARKLIDAREEGLDAWTFGRPEDLVRRGAGDWERHNKLQTAFNSAARSGTTNDAPVSTGAPRREMNGT